MENWTRRTDWSWSTKDRTKLRPTPKRKDARFKRRNAILAGQNWRDR